MSFHLQTNTQADPGELEQLPFCSQSSKSVCIRIVLYMAILQDPLHRSPQPSLGSNWEVHEFAALENPLWCETQTTSGVFSLATLIQHRHIIESLNYKFLKMEIFITFLCNNQMKCWQQRDTYFCIRARLDEGLAVRHIGQYYILYAEDYYILLKIKVIQWKKHF